MVLPRELSPQISNYLLSKPLSYVKKSIHSYLVDAKNQIFNKALPSLEQNKKFHESEKKQQKLIDESFTRELESVKQNYKESIANLSSAKGSEQYNAEYESLRLEFFQERDRIYEQYPASMRHILETEFKNEENYELYFSPKISARPSFQAYAESISEKAKARTEAELQEGKVDRFGRGFKGIIQAPTGTGKSVQIAETINKLPSHMQVLVIVPRITLEEQLLETIQAANPGKDITHLSSEDIKMTDPNSGELVTVPNGYHGDIVIAVADSIPQILEELELADKKLGHKVDKLFSPSVVFTDEIHNFHQEPNHKEAGDGDKKPNLQMTLGKLYERNYPSFLLFSATPDLLTTEKPGSKEDYSFFRIGKNILYALQEKLAKNFLKSIDGKEAELIHSKDLRSAINDEWLVDLKWDQLVIDEVNEAETDLTSEELDEEENDKSLDKYTEQICTGVIKHYKTNHSEKPVRCPDFKNNKKIIETLGLHTISICPNVKFAERLTERMNEAGLSSVTLSANGIYLSYKLAKEYGMLGTKTKAPENENSCIRVSSNSKNRKTLMNMYETGVIKHLTSVHILGEGWSSDRAAVCYYLGATKSYAKYLQAIGRILRIDILNSIKTGTKKIAQVVDLCRNRLQGSKPLNLSIGLDVMPRIIANNEETVSEASLNVKSKKSKSNQKEEDYFKDFYNFDNVFNELKRRYQSETDQAFHYNDNEFAEAYLQKLLDIELERFNDDYGEELVFDEECNPALHEENRYNPLIWHEAIKAFDEKGFEKFLEDKSFKFDALLKQVKLVKSPGYVLAFIKEKLKPNFETPTEAASNDENNKESKSKKNNWDMPYNAYRDIMEHESELKEYAQEQEKLRKEYEGRLPDVVRRAMRETNKSNFQGMLEFIIAEEAPLFSENYLYDEHTCINKQTGKRDQYYCLKKPIVEKLEIIYQSPIFVNKSEWKSSESLDEKFISVNELRKEFNKGLCFESEDKSKLDRRDFDFKNNKQFKKFLFNLMPTIISSENNAKSKFIQNQERLTSPQDITYVARSRIYQLKKCVAQIRDYNVSLQHTLRKFNEYMKTKNNNWKDYNQEQLEERLTAKGITFSRTFDFQGKEVKALTNNDYERVKQIFEDLLPF